jgi:hypothetical protein
MPARQHPINRQIAIQIRQHLLSAWRRPPIPHQVADDREQRHELDTRLLHARVGRVADELRGGARALYVGEDGVSLGAEGERKESSADVGYDAGDNDLFLAGCADGGAEGLVVPGAVVSSENGKGGKRVGEGAYLTSPWRWMSGALGYSWSISLGRGPLGPWSAEVVMMTGRLKSLPSSAWAMMLSR